MKKSAKLKTDFMVINILVLAFTFLCSYSYATDTDDIDIIANWLKESQDSSWGTWGTTYDVQIKDNEGVYNNYEIENEISQFTTLVVTQTLLKARHYVSSKVDLGSCINKAVLWVETQEYFNTEYLSRQIDILARYGKNTDLFVNKLLSLKNSDGGWGVAKNRKTNSKDTVWALKALLSSGYRNDATIKNALDIIITYTNKTDPDNDDDYFRWSTFHGIYSDSWVLRKESSFISANVYDVLTEYNDCISTLFPIKDNAGESIVDNDSLVISDLESFLITELDNDNNAPDANNIIKHVPDTAILCSVLLKNSVSFDNDSVATLKGMIEWDNESEDYGSYIADPYLTATILDCLCENSGTALEILNTEINSSNELVVTLSNDSSLNTALFYYYDSQKQSLSLFDSVINTNPSSKQATSKVIPYPLNDGDIFKVCINNSAWGEYVYLKTQTFCDLAVYDKDIKIYNPDKNLIGKNCITTFSGSKNFTITQKIYNLSDINVTFNVILSKDLVEIENDSVTLSPNEIYLYSKDLSITGDSSDTISLNISIGNIETDGVIDADNENNSSTACLNIIDSDNYTSTNLEPPLNLEYEIIDDTIVNLYWDVPLDTDVVGYIVSEYDCEATFDTTYQFDLNGSVNIKVYSMDTNGNISTDYASAQIIVSTTAPEPNLATITYPAEDQVISFIKDNDGDSYDTICVYGSAKNEDFRDYKVELIEIDNESNIIDLIEPDNTSSVNNGLLASIDLDNDSIISGSYNIKLTVYELDNGITHVTQNEITIFKWVKQFVFQGNECSNPSLSPNAGKTIFSSRKYSELDNDNTYIRNLWVYDLDCESGSHLTQLTDNYTGDMEPDWFDNESVLYTSYRTGTRNLVIGKIDQDNDNIIDLIVDNEGNISLRDRVDSLIDADNEQIYFQKSFYNPDYIMSDNTGYIVASDEMGELILIAVDNDGSIGSFDLTADLTQNEGKTFILADKPRFVSIEQDNDCKIIFEGYDIQLPLNYTTDDYYINSDIFITEFELNNELFFSNSQIGCEAESTNQYHWLWKGIFASGPYECSVTCIPQNIQYYHYYTGSYSAPNAKCFIYLDNEGYPGTKFLETEQKVLTASTSAIGWYTFNFSEVKTLSSGTKFWLVISTDNSLTYSAVQSQPGKYCFYKQNSSAPPIPNYDTFPDNDSTTMYSSTTSVKLNELCMKLEYKPVQEIEVSITNLTNTTNESETSPIWLDFDNEDILDVNIAFVSDKDFDLDANIDWNICLGLVSGTSSLELNNIFMINDDGISEGIIENLDFKNYRLIYDEVNFNTDSGSFENTIYYLDMKK